MKPPQQSSNTGKNNSPINIRIGVAALGNSATYTLELWKLLLAETVDAEVHFFSDEVALQTAARMSPGRFILFSNFPPDLINGFTYNDSKKFFSELLLTHSALDLHIITNAGGKTLSDEEVIELSDTARITIQRPWQWADYGSGFLSHVCKILGDSFEETGQTLGLRPGSAAMMKVPEMTENQMRIHDEFKAWCRDADPNDVKPDQPNVDEIAFRIWQRSNRVQAARKYAELSGD